jgi:hypothetical protein
MCAHKEIIINWALGKIKAREQFIKRTNLIAGILKQ